MCMLDSCDDEFKDLMLSDPVWEERLKRNGMAFVIVVHDAPCRRESEVSHTIKWKILHSNGK